MAVLCAYVPFLGGGFLTDDFVHLLHLEAASSVAKLFTAPDAFGFYRPLTQASLAADAAIYGDAAVGFRATNLALHAAVIALAFALGRLVAGSSLVGGIAALAFALTPKAHPIAVLWVSARGELLMAIFSLAAVASWIVWTRGGGGSWLVAAVGAYVLALFSKESAVLLPAVLVVTPGAARPLAARLRAAGAFIASGAAVLWWRAASGALMPYSTDAHYNLAVPLVRLGRNATNYLGRLLPSPAALVLVVGLPAWLAARGRKWDHTPPPAAAGVSGSHPIGVALFGIVWTVVLIAPTLAIAARNELYLYLPSFGACLAAAALVAPAVAGDGRRRVTTVALVLYAVALGGYQVSRSVEFHRDLVFSARLATALRTRPELRGGPGYVALEPANAESRRYLQDAIGGYLPVVLRQVLGRPDLDGGVQGGVDRRMASPVFRFRCSYDGNVVTLQRLL
jgi:hypothetical protein